MTVSVVVPTYNRVRLLAEAVESVLAQRAPGVELELVIVDDGSTDRTSSYLRDLRCRPLPPRARVHVIGAKHCGMPGKVRNLGVAGSSGTVLAFLDSDDLWLPGKIAAQSELHKHGAALSHTREVWLRSGKQVSQAAQKHSRHGWVFEDALQKCMIGPSTTMISRDLFESAGGFREDIEIAEDYELWLRITCRVPVAYLGDPYTIKRAGHGQQLSEKHGQIEIFRIAALRGLVDSRFFGGVYLPQRTASGSRPAAGMAREELARKLRIYAAGCRKRGRHDEAAQYESEAVSYETSGSIDTEQENT